MPAVRPKNTVYVSMAITTEEKAQLDAAVKKAGVNRNRFIRQWIATLRPGGDKTGTVVK